MAIFYDFIKGLKSNTNNKWSYLVWEDNTPSLYISTINMSDPTSGTNLGKFVVTDPNSSLTEQTIGSPFKVSKLYIDELHIKGNSSAISINKALSSEYNIESTAKIKANELEGKSLKVTEEKSFLKNTEITGTLDVSNLSTLNNVKCTSIQNSAANPSWTISSTGDAVFGGLMQASTFNSTSDIRAKDNLKPIKINALDIIKKVQLYTYRYKEYDFESLGIIAQDIQDVSINGVKLVDNENASGCNGDYMSIKESKLIYILWKAIQEQQEEIEKLKSLVEANKNGR